MAVACLAPIAAIFCAFAGNLASRQASGYMTPEWTAVPLNAGGADLTAWTTAAREDARVRHEPDVTITNLYVAHRLRLVRLAVLLVDDQETAEDVVHDVFTRLQHTWRLQDPDKALAYLQRAVVNRSRSVLRRRRTVRSHVVPHDPPVSDPEGLVLLAEEHREVLAALQQLPSRQREVLVLRYWSDLSEAQIAQAMGISTGTVKSTASRALDALERILEERER
jgi:RNA polymerase sigma-70 factor (sigma-E family)